ncbi:MAG TPA: 30S ribosomal protein S20 [Thermodesulfobacteriota bacterium]|nr:30S ribosomal protein S20 [Thermodesulfobacteriota bacterium]
MATHKSALKRSKQNKEKRLRNRNVKSNLKTTMKAVSAAIEEKDPKKAQEVLSQVTPVINKAASKGVIHKKNAARKISRLTRKVNALKS